MNINQHRMRIFHQPSKDREIVTTEIQQTLKKYTYNETLKAD